MESAAALEKLRDLLAGADDKTASGFVAVSVATGIASMYTDIEVAELMNDSDNYVGMIMYAARQRGPAFIIVYSDDHFMVAPMRQNVSECVRDAEANGWTVVDEID